MSTTRRMNAAVAAAALMGAAIQIPAGSRSRYAEAKGTSQARAIRDGRRGSQRGTLDEQHRRITAAAEKRARKNAQRIVVAEARDYWNARRAALVG